MIFLPPLRDALFGAAAWTPAALFHGGRRGAWISPTFPNVYADASAVTHGNFNRITQRIRDKSGNGNDAINATASTSPRWQVCSQSLKAFLHIKPSSDGDPANPDKLTISFAGGASLGSNCTIIFANRTSVEFRTGQTIGATYDIPKTCSQFLIIDGPLNAGETARVRTYFARYCAFYNQAYDLYADALNGDDSNNGLTAATAKATLGAIYTLMYSAADGLRVCLMPGAWSELAQFDSTGHAGLAGKTHSIHAPFGAVTIDLGETPGTTSHSAFEVNTPTYKLKLFGEGNLIVKNAGNNGWGGDSGTGEVYDTDFQAFDDGVTTHATATLKGYGCAFRKCTKGAVTNTGTAGGATSYFEWCAFYAGSASTAFYLGDGGANFDFYRCDFLPDPAVSADWSNVNFSSPIASASGATIRTVRESRLGSAALTAPTSGTYGGISNTTFSDCFLYNVQMQPDTGAASTNQFIRCYGKWSYRPRGTVSFVAQFDNCVIKGGANSAGNIFFETFYSSPTEVYGAGYINNSILSGCATAVHVVAGDLPGFNAQWALTNNLLFNNTTNYTATITPDGTDVTGQDPLLSNPITDWQNDWRATAGSPSLGAGVGGIDIGLGLVQ